MRIVEEDRRDQYTGKEKEQGELFHSAMDAFFEINLAGLPPQISPAGMSLATTDPAPTMAPSPIVTPFRIVEWAPIKTLGRMITGLRVTPEKSSGTMVRLR